MNAYQELWWRQAESDYSVLLFLQHEGFEPCHQLHYLQMATEKVAKAYFWRSNKEPPKSHTALVQFLRSFGDINTSKREQIAAIFDFTSFEVLRKWIGSVLPLAYDLERLAPALAQNGPNPEYPWPPSAPEHTPANFDFEVYHRLTNTGHGRQLRKFIGTAIKQFPSYG